MTGNGMYLVVAVMVVVWMCSADAFTTAIQNKRTSFGFRMIKNSPFSTQIRMSADSSPHWDITNMPLNTFKATDPCIGKIVSVEKIVGPDATGETYKVVINHGGKMPYWEGQSYGIIPPGVNPKNGKAFTNRLYSIASTRHGDDMTGTTTTFCVRRAVFMDPATQSLDDTKKGICSNFLCDAKPGQEVMMTGPTGKIMLLPEKNPNADLIMIATGTGIAPYRSFLRRLFIEDTPARHAFNGLAWLFLGVANTDSLLFDNEWKTIKALHPLKFRYDVALSREQTNKKGEKMYIQDKVEENSEEIFTRMRNGAHIYFCGLKGMMPGILGMFERVCKEKGIHWEDTLQSWKSNGQWHVEVY